MRPMQVYESGLDYPPSATRDETVAQPTVSDIGGRWLICLFGVLRLLLSAVSNKHTNRS